MDKIILKVDLSRVNVYLNDLQQNNQIPFTIAKALNNVALSVQKAIQNDMKQHLKLNREKWNLQSIKITTWAKKTSHYAEISIQPRATNLIRLTSGEQHMPINGRTYLAIPNPEVFKNKVITSANKLFIKNLRLQPASNGGGMIGDNNTYLTPTQPPLLLQDITIGRGKKKTDKKRLLYTLIKKSKGVIKIDFFGIAQKIINTSLDAEINSALASALRSSRR